MSRPKNVEVDPFNGTRRVKNPDFAEDTRIANYAAYLNAQDGKAEAPDPLVTEFTPRRSRAILHQRDSIGARRIA